MKHLLKAVFVSALIAIAAAIMHPDTPLPDEWNPIRPLDVQAPVTFLTDWKLQGALGDDGQCMMALQTTDAGYTIKPDFEEREECHIRPRVMLSGIGSAKLKPLETRCQSALLMAMWERHGLQQAARKHLGREVREIRHYSSYNCREMRTGRGETGRMSSHATANAIDVSGFVMSDGEFVDLKRDWPPDGKKSRFLKAAFEAACLWFPVALGPEFNALHKDHFHLQTRGWGFCR